MAQVEQEAEDGGYRLIDIETLSKLYASEPGNLLLVDTRQEWEHHAGNIERSVNFPMEPSGWARWQKRGALKSLLGQDKNGTIVFY